MSVLKERFTAHGIFTVETTPKRLLVDAKGPFNLETITQYQKAIESAIHELSTSNWTQVVVLHGMSMLTPDAESQLEQVILYRKKHGMFACAVVLVDVEGKGLVTQQFQGIYDRTQTQCMFTESMVEANMWLDDLQTTLEQGSK